jgi:hypothetical protein
MPLRCPLTGIGLLDSVSLSRRSFTQGGGSIAGLIGLLKALGFFK